MGFSKDITAQIFACNYSCQSSFIFERIFVHYLECYKFFETFKFTYKLIVEIQFFLGTSKMFVTCLVLVLVKLKYILSSQNSRTCLLYDNTVQNNLLWGVGQMKFILFAFSLSLSLSLSGGKSRQVGMGRGQNHLSLAWMLRIYSFFLSCFTPFMVR